MSATTQTEFIAVDKRKKDFCVFRRKQSLFKEIQHLRTKNKSSLQKRKTEIERLHDTYPIVEVMIRGCRNLVPADSNGKSDPYCVIFCGPRGKERKLKTTTKKACLNPVYNEVFDFSVEVVQQEQQEQWSKSGDGGGENGKQQGQAMVTLVKPTEHMRVEVWDWDMLSSDDFLGVVSIPLDRLPRDLTVFMDLPLCGVERGSIQLEVTAHNFGIVHSKEDASQERALSSDARIIRHASLVGGAMSIGNSSDGSIHSAGNLSDTGTLSTSDSTSTVSDSVNSVDEHVGSISMRYRNIKTLGSGYSAIVYLAEDARTGEQVAVKKIACRTFDEASQALQEAFTIRKFSHPNIVDYKNVFLETFDSDVFSEPCFGVCFVMGYYAQGDVARFLRAKRSTRKPIRIERLLAYFEQLASAVEYLHANKILHRDIKPHNVFIADNYNTLKLGDFGFVTSMSADRDKFNLKCGTPSYMAPEVDDITTPYNHAADIWSLGVTLYEMATMEMGIVHHAEARNNPEQYKEMIERNILGTYPGTHGLVKLIKRALEIDPKLRITAEQLVEAIQVLRQELPSDQTEESL